MKNAKFNIGDVVRLKSGGTVMTVEKILQNDMAQCIWCTVNGEHKTRQYHTNTLNLVDMLDEQEDHVPEEILLGY